MARKATGQVVCRRRKTGTFYGLRITLPNGAGRKSISLGPAKDGWNWQKAQDELDNVLADVRRGIWRPPVRAVVAAEDQGLPTFHEFASQWFERQKLEGGRSGTGLAAKSREDLEWRLTNHLLPAFKDKPLDQITVEDVDRFRLAKVSERKDIEVAAAKGKPIVDEYTDRRGCKHRRARRALSAGSINKLIATLAAILEDAVEYELIPRNVARGRRRRLQAAPTRRAWVDRADHITGLLDAARELDEAASVNKGQRRALLATLVFAGLRIDEALSLRWQSLDLARGTLTVESGKTQASARTVNLLGVLRDELSDYRARLNPDPGAFVFATRTGRQQGASNVRRRILNKAVAGANEKLAKGGQTLLPAKLTPHSLRRTFASLLFAVGEAPPYVMAQMGHTTANLTLTLYARHMDRRDGERERLEALVNGAMLDTKGTGAQSGDDPEREKEPSVTANRPQ
jgi:integrase